MSTVPSTQRYPENGQKIRRARKLTGLSQDNFAPAVKTTRRHLMRLERGQHRPSGTLRDRIVEVTGTEELIEASDDAEEDMLLELINSMIRLRQKRIKTGDPYAVLK